MITVGEVIRAIRLEKSLPQKALALKAGVDVRTLAAIEKGRIRNPSVASLQQIAGVLGLGLGELFGKTEARSARNHFVGSQRGEFVLDYPRQKFQIVSYLPKDHPFFVGKLILESKGRLESGDIRFPGPVFIQSVLGKIQFILEGSEHYLKEGQHISFNGRLTYSLHNPLLRPATALLVTAPSFC